MPKPCEEGLVSVVVPTYNRAILLGDAFGSVVSQSYRPIEVMIVDDGSTDNTEELVSEFKIQNPDIQVEYVRQSNSGPSAARNAGLGRAKGRYIQFLDSDDVLYPDKISRQIGPLVRGEADVVYSDYEVWNADMTRLIDHVDLSLLKQGLLHRLATRSLQLGCTLHRREAVAVTGGFKPALWTSEDWDFHLREYVLAGQRFKYVPCTGLKYRWTGSSLCSDHIHVLQKKLPVVVSLCGEFEREGKLTVQLRVYFAQLAAQCAFRSYRGGARDLGDAYGKLAKSWAPHRYLYGSCVAKTAMYLVGLRRCARLMNVVDHLRRKAAVA